MKATFEKSGGTQSYYQSPIVPSDRLRKGKCGTKWKERKQQFREREEAESKRQLEEGDREESRQNEVDMHQKTVEWVVGEVLGARIVVGVGAGVGLVAGTGEILGSREWRILP